MERMRRTPRVVALLEMGFTEPEIDAILDVANTRGMDPIEVGRRILDEQGKETLDKIGIDLQEADDVT